MNTSTIVVSAMLSAISMSTAAWADEAATPTMHAEKCYGVAKAGQNDCQTASHSCAGASVKDLDSASWIYLPVGSCSKISGGSLKPKA
jgi:uncharacterized membrane protein